MPDELKPVTSDPDEQELLKDRGIPLTDPNAKPAEEVAEPVATAEVQVETEPVKDEEQPEPEAKTEDAPAEKPASVAPPTPAKPDDTAKPPPDRLAEELAELEARIRSEDFDPYGVESRMAMLEHAKLTAQIEVRKQAEEQIAVQNIFLDAAKEHGVDERRVKDVWSEEFAKATDKYGKGDIARAVATERWNDRLASIKNGAKGAEAKAAAEAPVRKPPVAPTPITPAGAKVSPPTQTSVPPPPKSKTDEEELVDYMKKNVPGGLRTLTR